MTNLNSLNTQLFFFILSCLLLSRTAVSSTERQCFDFSTQITTTLRKPINSKSKKDVTDSGRLSAPKKGLWGQARGEINLPIQNVYRQLLNHYTIKDEKRTKLRIYPQEREGYQDFHVVMVKLSTPLMDVDWEENWGYVIAEGTEAAPKKVVISYQKTDGTKYMPHLCGSILLTAINSNTTDVYLYEEIDALGKRSPKDTVEGHLGTLATLRKGAVGSTQTTH